MLERLVCVQGGKQARMCMVWGERFYAGDARVFII